MMIGDSRSPEQVLRDRITELEGQLEIYRRAVRKVDDCCGCLNYGPYEKLERGKPGPFCDCGHTDERHEWKTNHDGERWLDDCMDCECEHWHQTQ